FLVNSVVAGLTVRDYNRVNERLADHALTPHWEIAVLQRELPLRVASRLSVSAVLLLSRFILLTSLPIGDCAYASGAALALGGWRSSVQQEWVLGPVRSCGLHPPGGPGIEDRIMTRERHSGGRALVRRCEISPIVS